ncbi:WD repeat and FYVE domain-containing protein 3-like [Glandiceps talaboti]
MNFVRKMIGRHQPADDSNAQDNELGLMHLRKLCVELCYSAQPSSPEEQEEKVYMMLPLFCKVFGSSPASDMINKFSDVLHFASHVSKLFVTEIRRRASNQSTEAASCSIADYLEIQSTEESSNGWMLLSTLNLLAAGGKSIVDVMTAASVPSTLVKCLYLFFDLPPVIESPANTPSTQSDFSSVERRILLQKICVQLLVRLCSNVAPAEELSRKDDLTLLFSAITSWCPPHNVPWRKGAAEVLVTLSRHGLGQSVVSYIHSKGCVGLCLDNMQREQALSPLDIVEMFVTVFCFLKDSSEVSNVLLDDFRTCQGYIFLTDFLLRLEQMNTDEARDALRNLVLLVSSLTLCGYVELKPSSASNGAPFQQPGFTVPQPNGQGVSVRNIQAFQVLQTVFLKAQTTQLCSTIIDVVSTVYNSDNANYFILESQNTISTFVEKIHNKPTEIQEKLFELLEFVVMHLDYVPCKELISISILIKTQQSVDTCIVATQSLFRILRYSAIYKDVYREVGLLEVMVTCLHRYAALLKDSQMEPNVEDGKYSPCHVSNHQTLAFEVMEVLTILMCTNSSNASVFRECGGARCGHNLVPYIQCRKQALGIVQQLVLSSGGDDDMGTLFSMMHSAPQTALQFKIDILQSLLYVLRDSHRSRTVFRKVGGFVYVMSVLVSMEGCLAEPPRAPWDTANSDSVMVLLHVVFQTLTAAMRHEPANAKFFATEVRYESLTDAIRLLGCFSSTSQLQSPFHQCCYQSDMPSTMYPFFNLFDVEKSCSDDVTASLQSACLLFRCLYDMAIDAFESKSATTPINSPAVSRHVHDAFTPKPSPPPSPIRRPQPQNTRPASINPSIQKPVTLKTSSQSPMQSPVRTPVSLYVSPPTHPTIVHPGAVISILDLLPAIPCDHNSKMKIALEMHVADVIQDLVKSERNQQVMCEAGLPQQVLRRCAVALSEEQHPLHSYLQHTLERLASQALEPKDLRDFLRLGNPLCCTAWDEKFDNTMPSLCSSSSLSELTDNLVVSDDKQPVPCDSTHSKCNCNLCKIEGDTVPLTRVKCLVSMTTPRDVRLHGASVTPSFVEFDMSAEGFGCLYLPSIAPQSPPNVTVVSVPGVVGGLENSVIGGIGSGERIFPPQAGLTFSVWLCVDRFSSPIADPHPVRLLTIVRNVSNSDAGFVCLSISLAAQDRTLVISTLEERLQQTSPDDVIKPSHGESAVKFWIPELAQEGQWHHLVVVLNRAVLKNSSVSVYLNGVHTKSQKLHYLQTNPGGGTSSPSNVQSMYSFIGTPPIQHCPSRLLWRLGPAHLFEDVFSGPAVLVIHQLGPNYVGSFQAPHHQGNEKYTLTVYPNTLNQMPEERLLFGIHAHALSLLTIAKIRKVYNKVDSKAVAKQLGLSSHENATPIRILQNSAGHLNGPARSLGAILLGNIGVRTFCPKPVARTLENVGGSAALLGLIAMATDVEGLYAAVKALVCVVKNNGPALQEMERTRGYQRLAMLLKKKKHLLNSHILHLTFSLVGTVDSGRESTIIPNPLAFEDLLCDMEVWHNAPNDLQKSLFEHFYELLTESSEADQNKRLMTKLNVIYKLVYMLEDNNLSQSTIQALCNVMTVLLQCSHTDSHLRRFGQFLVSTLPLFSVSEKFITTESISNVGDLVVEEDWSGMVSASNIKLRNTLLEILIQLLTHPDVQGVNHTSEQIQRILGFDWLLLFMQGHLHATTVIQALRILLVLLSNSTTMHKFRDGVHGGGWLDETEPVLHNRMGVVLGFNVGKTSSGAKGAGREINMEACHLPGFAMLQCLLPKHANIPELYFLLMALLLGHSKHKLADKLELDLDSIWKFIFGVAASQPGGRYQATHNNLCTDSALVILTMIRSMLNQNWQTEDDGCWLREYPVTLIQFLLFLYHNTADFIPICMSSDFLCALAATLFPMRPCSDQVSESGSELCSPTDEYRVMAGLESPVSLKTPSERSNSIPGTCSDNQSIGYDHHLLCYISIGTLTIHPARKFVMDFLRVIVVDSLSLPMPTKGAPVLDLLLEASPERSSKMLVKEFQTEILITLMEHLLAADALLGEEAALPIASGGSYSNMVQNVFYFASRVVDKLWQGVFTRDSKEVFDFISKLIAQAKRRSTGISLDAIYHCLNRTVLYQLSRPHSTVADQMALLDSLHRLTNSRNLVFGPGNYEQEFIACLCHCLFYLTDHISLSVGSLASSASDSGSSRTTLWHVDVGEDEQDTSTVSTTPATSENSSCQEGQMLVKNAAKRVWDELITCKKAAIEDIFKVTLPQSMPLSNHGSPARQVHTVDLNIARPAMSDMASKMWHNYLASEKRSVARDITQQNQSKLSKVSSGIQRLTRAGRSKKDQPATKHSLSTIQEANMWMFTHTGIVRDLVDLQFKQYLQSQQYMQRYIYEEWRQTETELTRERGLWGPAKGSRLDKWMLDMTEGPCRMRKKLEQNDDFYVLYPHKPEKETASGKPSKYRMAISYDSKDYYQRLEKQKSKHIVDTEVNDQPPTDSDSVQDMDVSEDDAKSDTVSVDLRQACLLSRQSSFKSPSEKSDRDDEDNESTISMETENSNDDEKPDNQTVLRLLEEGEKIRHMFRCARILGLDTSEGLLLFCKEHFYIVDGFTLLSTREICDIDMIAPGHQDPIIPRGTSKRTTQKRIVGKFAYEDIREVHKRRYLLQPIAIEVFSADGRNFLLAFPRRIRNKVYSRLIAEATGLTDSASQSVSGQKRNAQVEAGSGLFSSLMGEKSVTQRWERGELSNFQYLMHLNSLAGRSYNDLMQYQVFPWILADYDSEELDLNDPKTFRDLSKPMGAQTGDRLKNYEKRFNDWEDPNGETPPYHYGTHYSSAMIVASYLVRMEPFTQHFLRLQGGHFDLADRMFHSIKEAWLSASKHNMADVKELIPEFFYLPEFLTNHNNFDLGSKQSGVTLGDVVLPPWAKGDPREYIRVHREALECDYVSAHLHEWIDLIFGYKQNGTAAEKSINVFHHLFYEGNVDIYSIEDPLKKNATIGFINNFGQIPKQLFKRPHPPRQIFNRIGIGESSGNTIVSLDRLFFNNLDNLKPSLQPIKELKMSVGEILATEKTVLAVEPNKVLIPPSFSRYIAWGYADLSLRMATYDSEKGHTVFEGTQYGEILCAVCPYSKLLVTGGTSTVVHVWQLRPSKEKSKQLSLKQALYGHDEPVTCLAASTSYSIIVSGSRDKTCMVWDLNKLVFVRQLREHAAPVAAIAINNTTGDIVTCAGTFLYIWSINGDVIASVNTSTGREQQILCCAVSELVEWDPANVIVTGSSDGVIRMWGTEFVQVPADANRKLPNPVEMKGMKDETDHSISHPLIGCKQESIDSSISEADTKSMDSIAMTTSEPPTPANTGLPTPNADNQSLSSTSDEIVVDNTSNSGNDTETTNTATSETQSKASLEQADMLYLGCDMKESEERSIPRCENKSTELRGQGQQGSLSTPVEQRELEMKLADLSNKAEDAAMTAQNTNREQSNNAGGNLEVGDNLRPESPVSDSGSYVIITESELSEVSQETRKVNKQDIGPKASHKNKLKPGFKWERQLIFRSKLTMHTAYERKDNSHPAAVTSLAFSKDHTKLFVGDDRGRVFSWSVTDQPGRVAADHWVKDEGGDSCVACNTKFSFSERRHHCRNCGQLFCSRCSRFETEINRLRIVKPVRVCQACFNILKAEQATMGSQKS